MYTLYRITYNKPIKTVKTFDSYEAVYKYCRTHGYMAHLDDHPWATPTYICEEPDGFEGEVWVDAELDELLFSAS